jgi:exportin-7
VKTTGFIEWLELAGDFTIRSLQNWQYSMNSIHYLLALWGRLVAALPYLRADATDSQRQSSTLRQCVLSVVESYIKTMLDSVEVVVDNEDVEDPLEDEGSLKEQMERLPVIARLKYETVAQYLIDMFEQALTMYEQSVTIVTNNNTNRELKILEGRMTWLTYMIASVIDTQTANDPRKGQSELVLDGRLSRYVFQLIQLLDFRLNRTQGQGKCDSKLEVAILNYFKSFKKVYMTDSIAAPNTMLVPGGSQAHPLLQLALSYTGGVADKESTEVVSVCFTVYFLLLIITNICTLYIYSAIFICKLFIAYNL